MRIVRAQLRQFRNHDCTELEFGATTNALLGNNGEGKTNVLEALSFLCLTKSFYAASDATVLQKGKDLFEVKGTLLSDVGIEHAVRAVYESQSNQKKVFIDGKEPERLSSVIGQFPIVVLSPENSNITFGTPADRRRFMDLVIAQSSGVYFEDLLEYRRVLRQRNKILSDIHRGFGGTDLLEPWNETLVAHGAKLLLKRAQFFDEFAPYIKRAYGSIAQETETPVVEYLPQVATRPADRLEDVERRFREKLVSKKEEELRLGITLVGPHRDEVVFSINALQLRSYASQGQHKTFLVALKVAEFFYLKERCTETPVILLDDVFTELDETRSQKLIALIDSLGQSFITTTNEHVFQEAIRWDDARRKFMIRKGTAVPQHHGVAA